jgi:hypothetical protein
MQSAELDVMDFPQTGYSENFPTEVEFIISALEAGPRPIVDRQREPRLRHRVKGVLRLFSDAAGAATRVIYTRQVSAKGLGFVTDSSVPLSHGGVVSLPGPDGREIEISCVVLRCREAAPGWYEGAVYFNRAQTTFNPHA